MECWRIFQEDNKRMRKRLFWKQFIMTAIAFMMIMAMFIFLMAINPPNTERGGHNAYPTAKRIG